MNRLDDTHLTTKQLYALLDAPPGIALHNHLHRCAACQSELEGIRALLSNFRLAMTGLASTQSPRLAPRYAASTRPRLIFKPQTWAASFATAAVLLGLSLFIPHRTIRPDLLSPLHDRTVFVTPPESDEALLDGIQRDLSTSIPPSLAPLALPATASSTSSQD